MKVFAFFIRMGVGAALGVLRRLSPPAQQKFAFAVAWVAWALHIRRAVTLDNIQHAYPTWSKAEQQRLAQAAYRSMSRAMLESVTSDLIPDDQLEAMVDIGDWKGLDGLLKENRPVLIASAHFGSWELFAEVMARKGYQFSAVVRPLSGAFNEWVVQNRKRAGFEMILQRGAVHNMLAALRRNRVVVQLIDQAVASTDAAWVPFFGRLASTTTALSMAAVRSGAPVYVIAAIRKEGRLSMSVDGPVELVMGRRLRETLEDHAARLTALIERHIRAHPEQWLWLHRRWKGKPPVKSTNGAEPRLEPEGQISKS
jgi:KDO2-lipid IV(A) lauroyltransferase